MGIDHFRERENGVGLIWNKVRNTHEVDQAREREDKRKMKIQKEKRKEKMKEKAKKGC